MKIRPGEQRAVLGAGRLRGAFELGVWAVLGIVVAAAAAIAGPASLQGWALAAVLLLALTPYVVKSLRLVIDGGALVADAARRAFLRNGRRVVDFDDVVALHSRMVNATCAEFELSAECRDGRRVVLYEGEPTNANYRTVEKMARMTGAPFHHRL